MTPALQGLRLAVDAPRDPAAALGSWREAVRRWMAAVRDVLVAEADDPREGWLVPREHGVLRERNALIARLSALELRVLEGADVEPVRTELRRLLGDVAHHVQRLHDLAYDEVEGELGGSD
jgi:hypothetical protein